MKKNIFFVGLLLLLVACSKNKDSGSDNNPVPANTILIKNSVFSPPALQVNINVVVTWINDDNMVHTVTADDGSFNSGDIAPGAKYMHTFSNTGTYDYHCAHHSGMVGAVTVTGIR